MSEEFYLGIVGSRDFADRDVVDDRLRVAMVRWPHSLVVVSGGAEGPDTFAAEFCAANELELIVFEAEWDTYGSQAGPIRNGHIVDRSDLVAAFWDGESRGTRDAISRCLATKTQLEVWFA